MICEMCGAEKNSLNLIEVDGALLKVCPGCAKFGKGQKEENFGASTGASATPLNKMPSLGQKKGAYTKDVFEKMGDEELIEGYGKVIRQSREALHLSQDDLARQINEKKSIIAKLESGSMTPSDKLVSKIEHALQIKLKEKYEEKSQTKQKDSRPVTLGDLVNYED